MKEYPYAERAEDAEVLARRIEGGDRAAETALVELYCDCVFAMALSRTRDREAARELVDEVLMAVIAALRRGGVHERSRLSGFVRGTAKNIINGYVRCRRRGVPTVPLDVHVAARNPGDDYERQDRQLLAARVLELLSPRDRQILQLCLIEGLKPGEIAARLRVSSALVRQRKCRALRAIVAYLEDESRGYAVRRMLR